MVDPSWAMRTPDANDQLLKSGPGPSSMLAALAAYLAEMGMVEGTAGASQANMVALNAEFQGAANVASTTTVTAINTVAHLLFGWLAEKPPIITVAVDAYTLAHSTMVPMALCVLNREEWAMFDALNTLLPGLFLAPMLDRDREYFGHFWPNNAGAGAAYAATLAGLIPALAIPPPITPPGASPELPASAAAAVAQTAAAESAGAAMRASSDAATQVMQGPAGAGSMTEIAGTLLKPAQHAVEALPKAFEAVAGVPQKLLQPGTSLLQSLGGLWGGAAKAVESATVAPAEPAARPVAATPAATGLGPTAGAGAVPATGPLTHYTRPVGSFQQSGAGRPTGLRTAGLLHATDWHGPTTSTGGPMPMGPGGMLARGSAEQREPVSKARVVVDPT